jgi:hypothetical protein
MKQRLAVLVALVCLVFSPVAVDAADRPAGAAASAADVTGTWDFIVETAQGSGTPVFTLKQDGTKLSGTYKGQFGEASVSGTIQGSRISLSVTVNMGEPLKIDYVGTVDGTTMKGTAKFGSEGDGTFTAKKR